MHVWDVSMFRTQFAFTLTLVLGGVLAAATSCEAGRSEGPPNIVFILTDDLGWADVECYRQDGTFDTPNIDQLAAEGVRFTDFYAACPVCSPTRASIQAGQYQARLHLTDFIPGHWRPFEKLVVPYNANHLPDAIETPAELLSKADYTSGYFGKWHLGWGPQQQPKQQGYDVSQPYGGHWKKSPEGNEEYATQTMTRQAEEFIEQNRENPFFLFLSPFAVHIPLAAEREKVTKYEQRLGGESGPEGVLPSPVYAAMVEHVDDMVGAVVTKLEASGLTENTVVIFTSDNGGLYRMYLGVGDRVTDNGPLRGEKGTIYEGGIRVPCIIKAPGIAKAGVVCDEPTISVDFWPTMAQLAGVGPDDRTQRIDGMSLVPLLSDPEGTLDREAIFWHYPHYHHMDPTAAVRAREWKLIRHFDGQPDELFHLGNDLGEETNLATAHPDVTQRLNRTLDTWLTEVDALLPTENEKFDASRAAEWWNRGSGKPVGPRAGDHYRGSDVR